VANLAPKHHRLSKNESVTSVKFGSSAGALNATELLVSGEGASLAVPNVISSAKFVGDWSRDVDSVGVEYRVSY